MATEPKTEKEITVEEKLKALYELQKVDSKIDEIKILRGDLPLEVQEKLMQLPFVTDVELTLVWKPAWSKDRMSDEAKMALDMF